MFPNVSRSKWTLKDYEKLTGVKSKHQKKKKKKSKSKRNTVRQKGAGQLGHRKKRSGKNTFLKNHLPALLNMTQKYNSNSKQRNALIDNLNIAQQNALKRISKDFLKSKFPISPKLLKKLAKDKQKIYKLAENKTTLSQCKKYLKQKGGFVGALIPLAVSLLSSIL